MITVEGLRKSYGGRRAVDDLTFTVAPGIVTGFLGPNGAGKSTTMRLILGLDRPDTGRATVNGKPLVEHPRPLAEIGALLEARIRPEGGGECRRSRLVYRTVAGPGAPRLTHTFRSTGSHPR